MELMVSIEGLSFTYDGAGRRALEDVSMAVPRGAFAGIAGASGSGKSTLLKCIAGIVPHYIEGEFRGSVVTCGRDTVESSPAELARFAGYVGEDIEAQFVCERVEEELLFGLENFGASREEIPSRLEGALAAFSLEPLREREIASLSGGQKQKTAIAAMAALSPSLLILDSPSSELDPSAAEALYEELAALNAGGVTIIAADQRLALLCRFCSSLTVLENGRIAAFGTAEEAAEASLVPGRRGLRLPQSVELGGELRRAGFIGCPIPTSAEGAAELIRGLTL